MLDYNQIYEAVSLYSDSKMNDTKAVKKIEYNLSAIRADSQKWALTIDAHIADGAGKPLVSTIIVNNRKLMSKLSRIGAIMNHYYIRVRPGKIDSDGNIVYSGDESIHDIGKEASK